MRPPDGTVRAAFEPECILLSPAHISPLYEVTANIRKSVKYKQIAASIVHVGLIEPIVVYPTNPTNRYLLLDGHVRHDILRDECSIRCLIATDDEAFTYNKRVSRLAPIQEHYMILRAIQNGSSEQRIASALQIDVVRIKEKRDLLIGICKECADLLKDQRVSPNAFVILRKMKPVRQVAAAELMLAARTYSTPYVRLLLAGTPTTMLIDPEKPKAVEGLSTQQQVTIGTEMDVILRDLKDVEANYGEDIVTLTVSCRYAARLLANDRISKYLRKCQADVMGEVQAVLTAVESDKSQFKPGPIATAVSEERKQAKSV